MTGRNRLIETVTTLKMAKEESKLTTFEKCRTIRNYLARVIGEIMVYRDSWSVDFCIKEVKEAEGRVIEQIGKVHPADLTSDQMKDLGFGKWSDKSTAWLIPLWLYPFLEDEMAIEHLDGKKEILKKADMDTDNRCGFLAYSVEPESAIPLEQARKLDLVL